MQYPNVFGKTGVGLYNKYNVKITNFTVQNNNEKYSSCEFMINDKTVLFRNCKKTPKKIGHFVSLWTHNDIGDNTPYNINDKYDIYIFQVVEGENFGQFIFDKGYLLKNGILSGENSKGKLGFRLYAPWYKVDNNKAKETQQWQIKYFFDKTNFNKLNFN